MTDRRPRIRIVLERSDGQVTQTEVPGDFVDDEDAREVVEALAAMPKTLYQVVADAFGVTRGEAKERLVGAMYGGKRGSSSTPGLNIGPVYGDDAPGWVRVGRYDSADRRALWIYDPDPDDLVMLPKRMQRVVVMRAGREGDDAYIELRRGDFPSDEKWLAFVDVVARALYAARDTKDGGAP